MDSLTHKLKGIKKDGIATAYNYRVKQFLKISYTFTSYLNYMIIRCFCPPLLMNHLINS